MHEENLWVLFRTKSNFKRLLEVRRNHCSSKTGIRGGSKSGLMALIHMVPTIPQASILHCGSSFILLPLPTPFPHNVMTTCAKLVGQKKEDSLQSADIVLGKIWTQSQLHCLEGCDVIMANANFTIKLITFIYGLVQHRKTWSGEKL